MELGPKQKEWVAYLKKHPEQQGTGALGQIDEAGTRKMCCLGVCLLILNKEIWQTAAGTTYLHSKGSLHYLLDYEEMGLRSDGGFIINYNGDYTYLATMNDNGYTWAQIADFIEKNPDKVFTHSV